MVKDENNEGNIKTTIKSLSMDITTKYVRKIVREATIRAVKKQGEQLNKASFLKLEKKLKELSEKDKIEHFQKNLDEISEQISKEGIKDANSINRIRVKFEKAFQINVLSTIPSGAVIVACVAVVALLAGFIVFDGFTGNEQNSILPSDGNIDPNSDVLSPDEQNNCSHCNGTGIIVKAESCTECGGDGIKNCSQCGGDYYVSCKTCLDRGEVSYDCPECGGRGYVPCTACDMTGEEECDNCGGDGTVEKNIVCHYCNKGKIP